LVKIITTNVEKSMPSDLLLYGQILENIFQRQQQKFRKNLAKNLGQDQDF
jgi:hypothetical protein